MKQHEGGIAHAIRGMVRRVAMPLVKVGDSAQAMGLMRDATRHPGNVHRNVVGQAKRAMAGVIRGNDHRVKINRAHKKFKEHRVHAFGQ